MVIGTKIYVQGPGQTQPDGFLRRYAEGNLLPKYQSLRGPGKLGTYRIIFLFLHSTAVLFNYWKLPFLPPPENIIKHLHAVSATTALRGLLPAWSFGRALLHDCVMTRKQNQPNSNTFLLCYNQRSLQLNAFIVIKEPYSLFSWHLKYTTDCKECFFSFLNYIWLFSALF